MGLPSFLSGWGVLCMCSRGHTGVLALRAETHSSPHASWQFVGWAFGRYHGQAASSRTGAATYPSHKQG